MIIVRLIGGLGNQMFQYAFGRALSDLNNTPLKLDITNYETDSLRKYELGLFPIKAQPALKSDVHLLKGNTVLNKLGLRKRSYVVEQSPDYDDTIKSNDVYLEGYWQSEKYFSVISKKIREDFRFIYPASSECIRLLKPIVTEPDSVCVHVRRGDYVSNPETKAYHTTQNKDYYYRAMETIKEKVGLPHFFLFCDEPLSFSSENVSNCTYSHLNTYDTFYLMSRCKHHIIANSSFSWWAAWLGKTNDQVVVAPNKWYNVDRSTKDLIPEGWLRI